MSSLAGLCSFPFLLEYQCIAKEKKVYLLRLTSGEKLRWFEKLVFILFLQVLYILWLVILSMSNAHI